MYDAPDTTWPHNEQQATKTNNKSKRSTVSIGRCSVRGRRWVHVTVSMVRGVASGGRGGCRRNDSVRNNRSHCRKGDTTPNRQWWTHSDAFTHVFHSHTPAQISLSFTHTTHRVTAGHLPAAGSRKRHDFCCWREGGRGPTARHNTSFLSPSKRPAPAAAAVSKAAECSRPQCRRSTRHLHCRPNKRDTRRQRTLRPAPGNKWSNSNPCHLCVCCVFFFFLCRRSAEFLAVCSPLSVWRR